MRDRFSRVALVGVVILLAALVAQPYIDRAFFSGKPHVVEPRGSLADGERTAIEIFERVAPSVVQVVARSAQPSAARADEESGGVQSGTGFMWDASGHVVTNSHVVAGTSEVVVRLASGAVVRAQPVVPFELVIVRSNPPWNHPHVSPAALSRSPMFLLVDV